MNPEITKALNECKATGTLWVYINHPKFGLIGEAKDAKGAWENALYVLCMLLGN